MARKIFISYKYSEAQNMRDQIIRALGDDATYYQGEIVDSPDLTDTTTENIRKNLTDMMHGTSVTIVVVSPSLKDSKWVDWEIEYSLKEITREDRTSRTNGIVGVIMKNNGGYDWLVNRSNSDDGCTVRTIKGSKLYKIINANRYNLKSDAYACGHCKTYRQLNDSYMSLIKEEDFFINPGKYIENAYKKCKKATDFNLSKQR